ncbi:MAG: cell division ATP-binding protein FtsE [Candidatus Pacebacteria bacterium]|nr:cell division ATP-binding protein FtsE [Candidatus Paceibacterota bacterium]MCD8508170.1 cell division ATP-binding protein FtsE [Candidatus Paceibacterota bacterium]MCD8563467.1 cell division ATP-binding protein FtsE [Candidatus Paceibacterota bacterium]
MIYFDHVSKVFEDRDISLEDINLSISAGEFVSIIGPSGAGKTTLVRLILAEVQPTSGSVSFESQDLSLLRESDIPAHRQRIGVVFQDFRLLKMKTVYENIAFAMEAAGKTDEEILADVPYVLSLVNLDHKKDRFPHQLSGGERQRLAIARAIINQPDVVIADEPTGNLDPESAFEVIEILKKINDLGTTIILTTHNPAIVDALKKRVIKLDQGRIQSDEAQGNYQSA